MGSFEHHKKQRRQQPGKIDSPLNEKLKNVKWGEFKLGDLFEILTYKKRFDANKVELVENCGHPYVVRTSSGNGQKGFIDEDEIYLNDGNTISFGQDTATMYYQEVPYFTGDKIKILKSKLSRFGKTNAQFFLATMRNSFQNFTWGSSSFNVSIIANQKIQLPLKENALAFSNPCDNIKNIDFDFMESFIRELEEERIRELNAYLLATGLKDYALSAEEEKALEAFKTVQWGEFEIGKVFDVLTSKKRFDANKIEVLDNGKYPYVVRTALNNGIKGYLNESKEYLNDGNSISFGQDTATMFYQEHPYFTGDKIKIVKCKSESFNKLNALYFLTSMNKTFSTFSWGSSSFNVDIINCQKMQLPTKNNKPDYATMETFIKAVEKLVIKDVVLYADSKIKATKNAVKKDFEYKINEDAGLLKVAEK